MKDKLLGFYDKLDRRVLPYPVKFLTNPIVILLTFILLIPLIGFAGSVVFVLVVNSYLNVTSVGVSSIVLRMTNLVAELQEKRAQQDHDAILAQFEEVKQMHKETQEMMAMVQVVVKDVHQLVVELHSKNSEVIPTVIKHEHFEFKNEQAQRIVDKITELMKKTKSKSW